MKTFKLLLFYFAVMSTVMFFARCSLNDDLAKITSSLDSLQVMVGTPQFNTSVHLEFIDAKTNEPISDKNVLVSIEGRDAAFVYNNLGSKQASYTSFWGMLDLIIDPHKADPISMSTNPIEFQITSTLDGYVSATNTVFISQEGNQTVTIPMINLNNPPDGFFIAEKEISVTVNEDGSLSEDVVVDFSATGPTGMKKVKGESASENIVPVLTIPKGAKFWGQSPTGSEGIINKYTSLKVKVEKVNFPTDGAFKPYSFRYAYTGYFLEYGSTRFTIMAIVPTVSAPPLTYDVLWTVQKVLTGNLGITLFLPQNFINPETNAIIKENDIISRVIFAYGETSILKEKQEVVKKINGKLAITSEFNPGSYGFHWSQSWGYLIPTCGHTGPKFTITSDPDITESVNFSVQVFHNKRKIPKGWGQLGSDPNVFQQVSFIQLPSTLVDVVFSAKGPFKFFPDTFSLDNPCENKIYTVNIKKDPSNTEWVSLNLDIELASESKNLVIKPSTNIYYYSSVINSSIRVVNGKASFYVNKGIDYFLQVPYGSSGASGLLKVEDDTPTTYKVTFTPQMNANSNNKSEVIFVPKTDNNEITIKYRVVIPDNLFKQF